MKLKFFNFLIILFIILIGVIGYFYLKKNIYSKEVLRLEILGPSETVLAQEVEYIVKYKNNGNFRLEEPELIFEPPEKALVNGEIVKRKILKEKELGAVIYPGEEKSFSFKMKLLGKEGEAKIAKASLSYRPKNLKARYTSETSFVTLIKSVPITFEFDLPSKIESGKNFIFRINYFSNLDSLLTQLRVKIEYPSGFEFIESKPKSLEKIEWEIPVLNKLQGGRIEITGKLSGEVGEAKIFKAKLGVIKEGEIILLKETEKGVEIVKPLIYLRQEINSNPQYTALPGEWLHYEIYFKNIGDEELTNLFMVNKLEGEAFDFQTIKSDLGNYRPGDESIVFDWQKVPKLQYLSPMEEGKVDFWIKLKDDLGNVKNPVLINKVFISQVKQEFITRIGSKLEITQKGYFEDEVFGNSGPIPPEVGKSTTYTILWQVKNYYSDVKDVKVKAILPQGAKVTGKIFPEELASKFSFDPESREIIWTLGDLKRGEGISTPPPYIAFQIIFTPEELHKGKTPEIIGEVKISGEDTWTEKILEATAPAINTTLPHDPTMTPEKGIVQ